jgi:hypothetical protein
MGVLYLYLSQEELVGMFNVLDWITIDCSGLDCTALLGHQLKTWIHTMGTLMLSSQYADAQLTVR